MQHIASSHIDDIEYISLLQMLSNSLLTVYTGFPQRRENESGHGKIMEKSWNIKNWPKVMEFCDQSWNFTNFVTIKKLSSDLEILHFPAFAAKVANAKSRRETVMENQEMVMEKSWENIFSNLWEPCYINFVIYQIPMQTLR